MFTRAFHHLLELSTRNNHNCLTSPPLEVPWVHTSSKTVFADCSHNYRLKGTMEFHLTQGHHLPRPYRASFVLPFCNRTGLMSIFSTDIDRPKWFTNPAQLRISRAQRASACTEDSESTEFVHREGRSGWAPSRRSTVWVSTTLCRPQGKCVLLTKLGIKVLQI